jgi:pyruvate dehydrogenase E1 component
MYLFETVEAKSKAKKLRVQLLGCGAILNEVRAAAQLLKDDYSINSDVWSVTSFNELARDGQKCARWNMLNPEKKIKTPFVSECLSDKRGPVVASSDYIRLYSEQIRAYVPEHYTVLGTDGFGRSDTREKLRHFFEIDRYYIVIAALNALSLAGLVDTQKVIDAMRSYNIDRNCLSAMQR